MVRLESLTALALGRGPYENYVIQDTDGPPPSSGQQYNEHGHPRNPETKRRERELVRAANEVMQVTGVVEDSLTAKIKANEYQAEKNEETLNGIRAMEYGRAVLVGGIWGVLGLRRRILLYESYSNCGIFQLIKQESQKTSALQVFAAGLPAVLAFHLADWIHFFGENVIETIWDEEDANGNPIRLPVGQLRWKHACQHILNAGFGFITLHFRLFGILQQLNLIPASQLMPSATSFIPFSSYSPLQAPPFPLSPGPSSLALWGLTATKSLIPLIAISAHGWIKHIVARNLYQPIYLHLPRPVGESIFAGMSISPSAEFDTPDRNQDDAVNTQDEPTLRALEGLPVLEAMEITRPNERESDSGPEEDREPSATLISLEVDATEMDTAPGPGGSWSAELRAAIEPKQSNEARYRVTGLTLLPAIMATEGLREVLAGIIVMPIEALLVRIIGRAYRFSAGLPPTDMYPLGSTVRSFGLRGIGNIASVLVLQLGVTGVVWIGFTVASQRMLSKKNEPKKD